MNNNVFFTDDESPSFSGVPSDIVQSTDIGAPTAAVSWSEPTASDNSGSVTMTSSHNSGSDFSIGDTLVTYTAIDADSNVANATFIITVQGRDIES